VSEVQNKNLKIALNRLKDFAMDREKVWGEKWTKKDEIFKKKKAELEKEKKSDNAVKLQLAGYIIKQIELDWKKAYN